MHDKQSDQSRANNQTIVQHVCRSFCANSVSASIIAVKSRNKNLKAGRLFEIPPVASLAKRLQANSWLFGIETERIYDIGAAKHALTFFASTILHVNKKKTSGGKILAPPLDWNVALSPNHYKIRNRRCKMYG